MRGLAGDSPFTIDQHRDDKLIKRFRRPLAGAPRVLAGKPGLAILVVGKTQASKATASSFPMAIIK